MILLARALTERGFAMRPRERRETSEQDLFRSRLDQIIDMKHALVKLARTIDWRFLEDTFGAVYTDKPGQPPLPTRLIAGLARLAHAAELPGNEEERLHEDALYRAHRAPGRPFVRTQSSRSSDIDGPFGPAGRDAKKTISRS